MRRKLLIFAVTGIVLLLGIGFFARFGTIDPRSRFYGFQMIGEWLDINFVTFGAPEKQVKHLEYADRRFDELMRISNDARAWDCPAAHCTAYFYERELASAEYMAEQLALIDHRYTFLIESVYHATFRDIQTLASTPASQTRDRIWSVAAEYNQRAIKNLLHKHQHTAADTERYRALVGEYAQWIRSDIALLTDDQKKILAQAEQEIAGGRELEWTYDLLRRIR